MYNIGVFDSVRDCFHIRKQRILVNILQYNNIRTKDDSLFVLLPSFFSFSSDIGFQIHGIETERCLLFDGFKIIVIFSGE